jgi:hypothetical protein
VCFYFEREAATEYGVTTQSIGTSSFAPAASPWRKFQTQALVWAVADWPSWHNLEHGENRRKIFIVLFLFTEAKRGIKEIQLRFVLVKKKTNGRRP